MKSALDLKQERPRFARFPSAICNDGSHRRLIGTVTKYLPVSGYGMVKSGLAQT